MITIRRKILCLVLAITIVLVMAAGCTAQENSGETVNEDTEVFSGDTQKLADLDEVSAKSLSEDDAVLPEYYGGDTLTVGYEGTDGIYNPIFAREEGDKAVSDLITVTLLERGRDGSVLRQSVGGTTETFEGVEYLRQGIADVTVRGNVYEFTLDENVYFSDGVNLTADDVIFTMYLLADPAYDGEFDFAQLPILGLEEYTGEDEQIWHSIVRDLQDGEAEPGDGYTQEDLDAFIEAFNSVGYEFTRKIVDYCIDTYGSEYSQFALGKTVQELRENEGLGVAFAEFFWGFAVGTGEDGLWYDNSGRAYDLSTSYPTVEEYWQLIVEKHGYDLSDDGINYENVMDDTSFSELLKECIDESYPTLAMASEYGDTANYISGIEKTGMYSFKVTMTEYDSANLYGLDIPILPLHHYGDRDSYKYSEHRFGFEKGDLSGVKQMSQTPLGAGPYEFVSVGDGGVVLQRNVNYYKGCPKITNINVVFYDADSAATLAASGDVDIFTDYSESLGQGDGLDISLPNYSYFGINAEDVKVGQDPFSEESKALRRAFSSVFLMHTVEEAAAGGTSFAISEAASERYGELTEAYGTADNAAKALLTEAGYVWSDADVRFTSSTGGAMTFEIRLRTDEISGTSGRTAAAKTAETFTNLGVTVTVTEYSNGEVLRKLLDGGNVEMWVGTTGIMDSETLENMFSKEGNLNYFSVGEDGGEKLLYSAAKSITEAQRKKEYGKFGDYLYESGVFTGLYRYFGRLYVSQSVNMETAPGGMTYFHNWIDEIENLELY